MRPTDTIEPLTETEQQIAETFAAIDETNARFPRYYYCWKTEHGSLNWVQMAFEPLVVKSGRNVYRFMRESAQRGDEPV